MEKRGQRQSRRASVGHSYHCTSCPEDGIREHTPQIVSYLGGLESFFTPAGRGQGRGAMRGWGGGRGVERNTISYLALFEGLGLVGEVGAILASASFMRAPLLVLKNQEKRGQGEYDAKS